MSATPKLCSLSCKGPLVVFLSVCAECDVVPACESQLFTRVPQQSKQNLDLCDRDFATASLYDRAAVFLSFFL